ncbi:MULTISPECIES: PilZ domain-containing protein [unclassified Modicisalibacter]|uniref:PilZ domain-containing protein n=1 Tax=unclassified Modicisalibacter TaxID=2679913 RepID=UPI001CCE2393|nr:MULTISPECIES: PilZ domain-containing protein [unclassified Modicisalibacter]MBZ9560307.1 PilZ domain-containing protein [Modicisalibacter sp. R2A 31.J]MBZ9576216.1 PilZ domain-containing protein [Modicisalibacter sp. MOD 31.J]
MPFLTGYNNFAYAIETILNKGHNVYILSKYEPQTLPATILEVDAATGKLLIEAHFDQDKLERFVWNGKINIDIEIMKEEDEPETLSLERIQASASKKSGDTYRLSCQLPNSIFVKEARGSVRIPFVLGMKAKANIVVYEGGMSLAGSVKNLSIGGCLLEVAIEDSTALSVGQDLAEVHIEFPNCQSFTSHARVRHMRPLGGGLQAAVGIEFLDISPELQKDLSHFVNECERESARRTGLKPLEIATSALFIASGKTRQMLQKERREHLKATKLPPMVQGVREVARRLQLSLMFLKNHRDFPQEIIYDCADTLLYLLSKERKQLLYALSYLTSAPDWVRHTLVTSVRLADYMLASPALAHKARGAIVGSLLHVMGKSLLLNRDLPSLKVCMTPTQKEILRGHVTALLAKFDEIDWQPGSICLDVIVNANERLDGSGYPAGKRGDALSDEARYMAVVKIIDKLTHPRNGAPPQPPIDAYRWVNEHSQCYERSMLVEYIQTYGLYPIGMLARYSQGFLAWIVDVDLKGLPNKVHVVKNLHFSDTSLDINLTQNDFGQIGKLESIVNPADYDISR